MSGQFQELGLFCGYKTFHEHRLQKYMAHHHNHIMTYLQRGLNKEACIGMGALLLSQKVLDLKVTLPRVLGDARPA